MDSLKFTSLLSVLMSALLITITLGVMGDRILDHTLDHVNWLPAPDAKIDDLINAVPMLTTAYVCHYNVHPIFSAMRNPSAGRMGQVVTSGVLTTSIIYWLFAFAAYALFGDKTQGDVLMNYGCAHTRAHPQHPQHPSSSHPAASPLLAARAASSLSAGAPGRSPRPPDPPPGPGRTSGWSTRASWSAP